MVIGCRDQRRKRSRCHHCIAKHLKCSGVVPCSNCVSRNIVCIASTRVKVGITIAEGQHTTLQGGSLIPLPILYDKLQDDDQTLYSRLFFSDFLPANSFTGRSPDAWIADLKQGSQQSLQLNHTVLALGALHRTRNRRDGYLRESTDFALKSYQSAIDVLRRNLETLDPCDAPALLTTTFLLGIFELMYDPSGEGWKTHAMFGTSRLLELFGPDTLISEGARNIFRQVRMFELFRGMLFRQSTCLVDASWQHFVKHAECDSADPLELLFQLMARASDLAYRTLDAIDSMERGNLSSEDKASLSALATEGFNIKTALQELRLHQLSPTDPDSHSTLVSIYMCAVSIYVSGIYDYDPIWRMSGICLPSLPRESIAAFVETIIGAVDRWLGNNMLSGLLYLIPLRIAGARCWNTLQELQVLQLLRRIQSGFAVAFAFASELEELWVSTSRYCYQNIDSMVVQ